MLFLPGHLRLSKEAREMIDIGKTPVKSVSRNLREDEPKHQQGNPEKEKRRIARKKERRATLILGNYLSSFVNFILNLKTRS